MEFKSVDDFRKSLKGDLPRDTFSVYEKALWWAGMGNWERAHDLVQDLEDRKAYRIHAYLHRQEGDLSNASYWYSKAATQMPSCNL